MVNNFNEIWEGEGKSITLVKNNGSGKAAGFIELSHEGDGYEIKSAFPVADIYPQRQTRKLLWKSQSFSSTATGERNPFLSHSKASHHAPTRPEGTPQSPRGQSTGENINPNTTDDNAPLASIGKDISDRVKSLMSTETIAADIRKLRSIAGCGVSADVQDIPDNPDMGKLVRKDDISFWER